MKGFVIAGTGSGSGKTTAALGIMAFLSSMGYRVAPFKVGPDFIDPGHHGALTGRVSRNLDSWMLSRSCNMAVFARGCKDADIAVVEGVMGLFDGYSGLSEAGSTAQMAKWLNLPVILIVDARSMARSAAAIVQGFENFDPDLKFAGVIFSKTGSPRHYGYLKEAVESSCRMPCLGFLPRNDAVVMPERHLGLVTSDEQGLSKTMVSELVSMVARNTVIQDLVLSLPPMNPDPGHHLPGLSRSFRKPAVRIGIARDKAFCFYYQDNFELLEAAGAELVFFSPLNDTRLPEKLHGLYFGGGYPELFAETLSRNHTLLNEIRQKSMDRMPIYGECGGFMYLCSEISAMDSHQRFEMTGCFPFAAIMSHRLRSLGYREITLNSNALIGKPGDIFRGHEFHYSSLETDTLTDPDIRSVYTVTQRDGQDVSVKGYQVRNTLGSYLHLHFKSMADIGKTFVSACASYQADGKTG